MCVCVYICNNMHKPGELFLLDLLLLKKSLVLLLLILASAGIAIASSEGEDLHPPLPVEKMAQTETSVTLSWTLPNSSLEGVHLVGISISYSSENEPEKVIRVPATNTTHMIEDLKPGTEYTCNVTAHYSNNKSVSTEIFKITTFDSIKGYHYRDSTCDEVGTRQVEKLSSGPRCLCQTGYQGPDCYDCSDGFYRSTEKCFPCPCSKETSLGTCHKGSDEEKIACNCKRGYIGMLCDACISGFYPANNYCVNCDCLNCDENADCDQCPEYRFNITDHEAVARSCGITGLPNHRTVKHEDGTVAIVAVVISLAFIACVAGGITCYRNRLQARNQVPFWSIELAEDKVSLNTGSDYQRLEGSSKQHFNHGHQRSSSVAEATVAKQRADQPQYNCISI